MHNIQHAIFYPIKSPCFISLLIASALGSPCLHSSQASNPYTFNHHLHLDQSLTSSALDIDLSLETATPSLLPKRPQKQPSPIRLPVLRLILQRWMRLHIDQKAPNISPQTIQCTYNIVMTQLLRFISHPHHHSLKNKKATIAKPKAIKPKIISKMLILGEGDFSYSLAFVEKRRKHNKRFPCQNIIATELRQQRTLSRIYRKFDQHIKALNQYGVQTLFGIDATTIHQRFRKEHITKIYFNCPHVCGSNPYSGVVFSDIIKDFFQSARQLQPVKGRIYLTIPVPQNVSRMQRHILQGVGYGLHEASAQAWYQYIKKRDFGPHRYDGYAHRQTKRDKSAKIAHNLRQYIFEKKAKPLTYKPSEAPIHIQQHTYRHYYDFYILPDYNTDYDSSDDE